MTPKLMMLIERALMTVIVVPVILMVCSISVAWDVHQARVEAFEGQREGRRDFKRVTDALLWKFDTALEIASAARLDLGNVITKLRAQVKQSSDDSAKATKVQTQAATTAVTKALEKTNEAIQAVAADPPAKAPEVKREDPPITVNVPPPVVLRAPAPVDVPKAAIVEEKPKRRRWFTYIWRWW